MELATYLAQTGKTYQGFAREIGIENAGTVRRYCLPAGHPDRRIPNEDIMPRIYRATGAKVTPNDFYDLKAAAATPPPARGAAAQASAAASLPKRNGSAGRPRASRSSPGTVPVVVTRARDCLRDEGGFCRTALLGECPGLKRADHSECPLRAKIIAGEIDPHDALHKAAKRAAMRPRT